MSMRKRILAAVMAISLILSLVACGNSGTKVVKIDESYPKKPVEIIVGFAAGGGTDVCARLVFQYAEKYFGQKFAIINKPGASGEIAWTELAKSNPDGYVIGFINVPTIVTHPLQRESCKYEMEDFRIIANMVTDPACFVVKSDSDINSLTDLYKKAKDNDVSIGYSGPGSSESLMLRQIEEITGTTLEKIPFDGSAPSVVSLLGDHIDAVCMNVSEAVNYTVDGSLKVIGVSSTEKVPEYPNVDTFEQQGIAVYNEMHRGVAAPAGVPDEYIVKIEDAIKKALEDPEFQKKAKEQNIPLNYLNSEEFTKIIIGMKEGYKAEVEKGEW